MNFYSFHIGDYVRDTRHLTWDEDAAYRFMIEVYYTREAPLPLDRKQIYRIIKANTARLQAAVDVILSEFFVETPQGFTNSRCEEELLVAKSKSETREERQANERERQKRHRERRRNLFNQLRDLDIVPSFDTTTETLEAMLAQRVGHKPVTRDVTDLQRLTTPTPTPTPNPRTGEGGLDWATLESQLRKAAGWEREPHPKLAVVGPIVGLIEAGASLEKDVLPIVKALAPGVKTRTSWSYFLKPIEQSWRERTGFAANGANGFHVQQVDFAKWEERMEWARKNKQWAEIWGPMPGVQGCFVPASLLKPEDGQGWTIWKQSA